MPAIRRSGSAASVGSSPAASVDEPPEPVGQRLVPTLDETVGVDDERLRAREDAGAVGRGRRDETERRVDLTVDEAASRHRATITGGGCPALAHV